ncbi:MAG: DUF2169 domain-containing protein [Nannocystaceae bacterium]|nr:DUF2169 domain-containing protein [bacterium]
MKVFKPTTLSLLTRCFEHERSFKLGVCVLASVPMRGDAALLPEQDLWRFIAEAMGDEGTLDATIPKVRAEYLVHATAYAPMGRAVPSFPVRAEVGDLHKDLVVHGDRVWAGRTPTDAVPLTSLRLGWHAAYGGPRVAQNPRGKGTEPIELETPGPQSNPAAVPLPNLERPDEQVGSIDDTPMPGGFGPIDISWPQRRTLAGTHDQAWLENDFPGHPTDVDWGLHNVAPRDQQRAAAWTPGEAFRFTNMHPTREVVEGRLPNLCARAFVVRSHRRGDDRPSAHARTEASRAPVAEEDALEDVALELRTLWFFPNEERVVLAFSGAVDVAEEEAADIVKLMIAAETPDTPKARSHYARVMADRLDEEFGALASLRDRDLLPEGLAAEVVGDEDLYTPQGLPIDNGQRQREELFASALAHLEAQGIDPAEYGLEPPPPPEAQPTLDELPALLAQKRATLAEEQAKAQSMRTELLAQAAEVMEGLPTDLDADAMREAVSEVGGGPPTFRADAQKQALEALAMRARMSGTIDDALEAVLDDPAQYEHWKAAEAKLVDGYRKTAHLQSPARRLDGRPGGEALVRFEQCLAAGAGFRNEDFTGAVLRNLDLRGADLSGGLFESADFTESDLRGANLDDAVLAHAKIDRARLDRASLRRANLGKAQLVQSVLDSARLDGANLVGARLHGSRFRGVILEGADLRDASFVDCDGERMEAPKLQLLGVTFERVTFEGATFDETCFLELDLRTCNFADASLRGCTFVKSDLREVNLAGSVLEGARAVEESRFEGAVFVEASLRKANFRGLRMRGADLRKAQLDDADLTECDLEHAKLYRASAKRARFDVANLRHAEMIAINLMQASLARATIENADLRGANLYAADMARVRTNAAVKLDDALLTKVRIHPRRVREEAAQ